MRSLEFEKIEGVLRRKGYLAAVRTLDGKLLQLFQRGASETWKNTIPCSESGRCFLVCTDVERLPRMLVFPEDCMDRPLIEDDLDAGRWVFGHRQHTLPI